jgi:twinkle protein
MIIKNINTGLLYEINPTKQSGEWQSTCPICSANRKKKRDRCFSWNLDDKVGKCHHCQASFVEFKDGLKNRLKKDYFIPEWENKTELSDKAVKWFEGRMISQATLREMKIFSDKVWMPQFNKEVEVMCYPYFIDGNLVNIKYRGPQKSFKMVKDAELVFFNLDCLKDEPNELIIVEGEMDALSFIDAGFKNVISVPNGAGSTDMPYLDNYIDLFDGIDIFYIAADFDDAGLKLRNELVRRLGADKCRIVTFEGHKDANELFCTDGGLSLRRIIENAAEVPVNGMISLDSKYDDIVTMYHNGLPEGNRIGVPEIDEFIRWQTSRLAIWTGVPSHGKSEFVDFITVKLCLHYGWKTLFFSPENFPLEFHFAKLASKITGKEFRDTKLSQEHMDNVYDYIHSNFFWIEPYEEATIDSILERTEQYVRRHGIKQLVVDPYNCLEHQIGKGESETVYIGKFLDKLSRFCKKHDILIHLVAHPAKMAKDGTGKYPPPTLYDISGSANFYNKADYGLSVHRNFETSRTNLHVLKVKFKNLGRVSTEGIELQYNLYNGRYSKPVESMFDLDSSNWIEEITDHYTNSYEDDSTPF